MSAAAGHSIAIIGAISLAARRTIIIQDASVLERIGSCRTAISQDRTFHAGPAVLTDVMCAPGVDRRDVPRSPRVWSSIRGIPGGGRRGRGRRRRAAVSGLGSARAAGEDERRVGDVASSHRQAPGDPNELQAIAPESAGLDCVVVLDDRVAAILRFRDTPRGESASFVGHLTPRHHINRVLIVSGDRESEVRYLADQIRVSNVHAAKSPEEKVEIVRAETRRQPTLYVGDGLNDAPAMMQASVAVALGQHHDVTSSAAGAVILDGSLSRVDELLHIARRTWRIALQAPSAAWR